MPQERKTLIMKFGGAALRLPENFSYISELIIERKKKYDQIVVVLSAMGGMTDHLISLAHQVNVAPPKREYDMLVSAGERISISLLAMALWAKGYKAVSFTGSQSGIITSNEHTEARIIDVRPFRLLPHLEAKECVIVAGFQGVSEEREITTLGRGGSDTTAVALGIALRAEKVEFFKDVGGIFEEDPKLVPSAPIYPILSYKHAQEIIIRTGGKILHPRAIRLAEINLLPLHILPIFGTAGGTSIESCLPKPEEIHYESLRAYPDRL